MTDAATSQAYLTDAVELVGSSDLGPRVRLIVSRLIKMYEDSQREVKELRAIRAQLLAENDVLGGDPAYYECPVCKMKSYNPNDIANKYCGMCHQFEDERRI